MNEGELKKRVRLFLATNMHIGFLESYGLHQVTDLDIMLDEARKDIFNSIPIEEIKGLTKDNPELIAKLLKWFGELEEGSLGSGKEGDKQ